MSDGDREQQELLEFLYACPVGLVEIDGVGTIKMINPHAMKHLLPMAGMRDVGNLFAILEGCAPELQTLLAEFASPYGTVCEGHRIAVEVGRKTGDHDPKMLACTLVKIAGDRAIATFADITAQVAQERRLQQAEIWFGSLLDGVNDYAVLAIAGDGIIEIANPSFTEQTGYDAQDVVGRSFATLLNADAASGALCLADQLRIAERDGWFLDEGWQQRKDGEQYWCQRLFAARMSEDGEKLTGFHLVMRDVIHRSSDTTELRHMLTHDHLTGATNRAQFLQVFTREHDRWQQTGQPLSLIMLDVDHFKQVNDRYGRPVGDQALRSLTETCVKTLGPGHIFARLGGDEFAVLLIKTALPDALWIAETLRAAIGAQTIDSPAGSLRVTASFGCAAASRRTDTTDAMIMLADKRMYAAKRSGRDRVEGAIGLDAVA